MNDRVAWDTGVLLLRNARPVTVDEHNHLADLIADSGLALRQAYPDDIAREVIERRGLSQLLRVVRVQEDVHSPEATAHTLAASIRGYLAPSLPATRAQFADPFVLDVGNVDEHSPIVQSHAATVRDALAPSLDGVTDMTIYYSKQKGPHAAVRAAIERELGADRAIAWQRTHAVHDRVLILDSGRAGVLIGTSLNGIGGKYFLVDTLRAQDARDLSAALDAL